MTKKDLALSLSGALSSLQGESVSCASTIRLLETTEEGYRLSRFCKFCLDFYKSLSIDSLPKLQDTIEHSSHRKSVHSEFPHLAKFLQLIYYQNPDFKKFITILREFGKKTLTFKEILDTLVVRYPNLFLNFFVKSRKKEKVIERFVKGKRESFLKDYNKTVGEFGHYNFIFAFKRHLMHLGILSDECSVYYGTTADYEIEEDLWILGDDILV